MLHYKVETMARSFDGADRGNKTDVQVVPDNGRITLDINALRKGQFYRVSTVEIEDKPKTAAAPAKVEPPTQTSGTTETDAAPVHSSTSAESSGDDGTKGEPSLD